MELIEQSYSAFKAFKNDEEQYTYSRQKMERIINGEIVTDSESDNPDLYCKDQERALRKKVEALKRSAKRRAAKRVASRKYLQRSCSRRVQSVTTKYPDIGTTIENFVQECNVGADAWRRTGILTFDGNVKVKKKATYNRIKEHLEAKYGHHFSYGTVVELCVARNKRRKSSHRYKGAAKVTSRRARKGFILRYNPDSHWSGALYRSLNKIQYADGKNVLNINRDDASGFRLDTLSTHKQYKSLSVQGKEVLTTHTNYVNKYKSVLQTTSYNFTGTDTTGEMCAGIVKAHGLYPKNPAQHSADLKMLIDISELNPVFINTDTNQKKQITCVHPLCQQKQQDPNMHIPSTWYTDGPPVSFIPLPVVDMNRPWGKPDCVECGGFCHGHYLKPEAMAHKHGQYVVSLPPSMEIQQFFTQLKGRQPSETELMSVAKSVLLPVSEVKLWLNHLLEVHKNRQRGAAKAAETRRAKRAAKGMAESTIAQLQTFDASNTTNENGKEVVFCGVCNGPYEEETEDVEDWICCDGCETWFHWTCVGLTEEPESFLCNNCK